MADSTISLKKLDERSSWDLMQILFTASNIGYQNTAEKFCISREDIKNSIFKLEGIIHQKLVKENIKANNEGSLYPDIILTSEGAKWWIIISELQNKIDIEKRISYFKQDSMMPLGFEPIAYEMWHELKKEHTVNKDEPTFCIITLTFKGNEKMKTFKILTTDSFAHYLIDPILPKILFKYPDTRFSVIDATIDREPESDLYLLAYEHPFDGFLSEVLTKGKLCLYANSHYLEKKGMPRTMEDLLHHNILRPKRSDVLLKFGVEKWKTAALYKPIYYKKDVLEVDTLTSLIKLGDSGAGIICYADTLEKYHKVNMEKIPELDIEDKYVNYTLGFHEKHKNNPIVEDLRKELKSVLLN